MKTRIYILVIVLGTISMANGQNTFHLTFTAIEDAAYVQLDSIRIINRTQEGDTVLYWPDTVLSIYYVGIHENLGLVGEFQVFQNFPNPVANQTTILLSVPDKDLVSITITDILSRKHIEFDRVLEQGTHTFNFTPGRANLHFLTAQWRGRSSNIKILNSGLKSGVISSIEYLGNKDFYPQVKAMKDMQSFTYNPGDQLLFIGYNDELQSGMLDAPEQSQTYIFQFATNIPCPGTPSVEYEGLVYNTVQILSQCWMKENMNVGVMIDSLEQQTNNGIIEKYCYNNEPDSCTKYGGLYQWNEMMQYTTQQGTQDLCPMGWHVPTDEEWKVLEGAVDSQYGIGDPIWNNTEWIGFDVGTNLKSTTGWISVGNGTDAYGFGALPGGNRYADGSFFPTSGVHGIWWSSSEGSGTGACYRGLIYYTSVSYRYDGDKTHGFSVRCLKD